MDLVSNTDRELENKHHYIPYRFALNSSSITTKVRVVLDASAKTATGVSLNDTNTILLTVGPKTQDEIICILLRF